MKKLITLCFSATLILSAQAIPTLSELADRVTSLGDRYASATNALAQYRAENTSLLESIAALHLKMGSLSNAVALIESKCETDASWRRIYHQGLAAQAICTNEYGIIHRVDIFNDGYVYADYKSHTPEPPDPEAEAKLRALVAQKREEAIAAMERANLPARVAEILAARRAAVATTNEVTVTIGN